MTDTPARLEALSRLEQMIRDERDDTWDLSNNDRAALRRVLDDLSAAEARAGVLEEQLAAIRTFCNQPVRSSGGLLTVEQHSRVQREVEAVLDTIGAMCAAPPLTPPRAAAVEEGR